MPFPQTNLSVHQRPSLLDTGSLTADDLFSLFREAEKYATSFKERGQFFHSEEAGPSRVIACLFFEPSTRTRLSFQTAAYRLGHQVLAPDLNASSSLSKGESLADTLFNIAAMGPDCVVIRYGVSTELDEALPKLPMPVLSAGCGTRAHPTQGLLDAFTIFRDIGSPYDRGLKGQRVLIVGDVAHSRVARSNFDVLTKLGAEVAVCAPNQLLPAQADLPPGAKVFNELDAALEWPTVYMGLRIQLERHASHEAGDLKSEHARHDYHERFGLNQARLKKLANHARIMHPGPINHGIEFSSEVLSDPRARVLDQVANGVFIRAALLNRVLGKGRA